MAGEREAGQHDAAVALRALASPLTVGSVALLALNDHVLKQAWPGWVTGKLSDVVGLVVAPVLLALVLALLRLPRAPLAAVVLTGAGFTWVKTTQAGADLASAAWTQVWGTSVVLRDPTDLLALPALAVAWRVLALARRGGPTDVRRRVAVATGALVLPFAVVATAATSCSDPYSIATEVGIIEGRWDGTREPSRRLVYHGVLEEAVLAQDGSWRSPTYIETERVTEFGPVLDSACDPRRPRRCWRLGSDRLPRVDSTVDGGRTWVEEYELPQQTYDALMEAAAEEDRCGGDVGRVEADDIAVLPTDEGLVVAVAAAEAGLLLRNGSGTWSRLDEVVDEDPDGAPTLLPEELITPVEPTPRPGGSPSGPDGIPSREPDPEPQCESPSPTTVTPNPMNGPPTTYEVCP